MTPNFVGRMIQPEFPIWTHFHPLSRQPSQSASPFTTSDTLTPRLNRWQELWLRVFEHNGGSPLYARHQRRLLLEAGCDRSEAQASVRGGGTLELTRSHAQHMLGRLPGPTGWDTAIAQGWVTPGEVEELEAEVLAWGERPDACFALPLYTAVGWVDA